MSSWDINDANGFNSLIQLNVGQINIDSNMGSLIYKIASNDNYKTFLEIGTWNGLGSTKCFIEGFKNRKSEFTFYSLECNTEKVEFAKNLYKNMNNIHILNEVIINTMPQDIYNVFPELQNNERYKYWNNIDFENMKNKPLFLSRSDIPDIFDVLLLDGGDFTTWYEYQQLKDKCNLIILDDTNVSKCKDIKSELKISNDWNLIVESDERNGYAIFERNKM
jgi:hypothetical protein